MAVPASLASVATEHKSERSVLTRDLSEFLVELSVALHRYSMYPSGHPSLGPVVDALIRRAEKLLQDRPMIALGVARRQLIIEGVATDPNHPVLRRLAEGLHRHHLGAISIKRGIQSQEFGDALRALCGEAERDGPLGLKRDGRPTDWPHLKLHPLTFDGLALVDDKPLSGGDERERRQAANDAELWIGLARAALSAEEGNAAVVDTAPLAVARAIEEHPRVEAYDQVIVGYLLQIAHELKTASGDKAEALRRKTSQLVASLRPETLNRLVKMGGNTAQRRQFVLDAAHGMALDAVIEIVKAAADASRQTISRGLVRMLSKLALHAELGSDLARPRAGTELREQVAHLLENWDLQDPTPETYGRVLQQIATSTQHHRPSLASRVTEVPESVRLIQMSLELGTVGPLVERALDDIVHAGQAKTVTNLLANQPDADVAVADSLLTWLVRPSALKELVSHEPLDVASLDALLPRLSVEGYQHLLDALASSENRATRRRLLDRLSRTEVDLGPLVLKHLDNPKWYVQRNMLILLQRAARVPEGFSAVPWAVHPDPRVRCEAIRLQLRLPAEREPAIVRALDDVDHRIVHLALTAIRHPCPEYLIARVISLAVDSDWDDDIRALAVNVIGKVPGLPVLEALLELTECGRSLLGRFHLPLKTPVLLAALRALSETWASDPRAATVLVVAIESNDPEVRAAVSAPPL
jgi:hypothetical protein